mgnify:CR=1 FL=1
MPRLFCPKCSSVKDVIPIEYGLPGVEMMEEGKSPVKSAWAAAASRMTTLNGIARPAATSGKRTIRKMAGSFAWYGGAKR